MANHTRRLFWLVPVVLLTGSLATSARAAEADPQLWEGYIDYAYVYSSADSAALQQRLTQYGREAGLTLEEYLFEAFEARREERVELDEVAVRREAIGNLLLYLATRDKELLDRAVDGIDMFEGKQGRHEDMYWLHYIKAQKALERENTTEFVQHNLDMWLDVVVPLESSYASLEALSLAQSPNSGFVSALPYVFENMARMILIQSQEMGMSRDLDPLVAILRLLADGRVGGHPDVIPREASSIQYVDSIMERVKGWESDGGSLTFTLALFEASRYHERSRGLLANEGFTDETIKAIGIAGGAYEAALDRSETLQGRAAVYIRVLRQLGEVYAAKQRLGVDPYVETPFQIEGAIDAYAALFDVREGEGWRTAGFQANGRDAYVTMLHSLWEEIQETHLNVADYYLARSAKESLERDELVRNAARVYARYVSFFEEFATSDSWEFVPDSAYFAAYECAKGFGDSYTNYMRNTPTPTEVDQAAKRYALALETYPFDRRAWSPLASALERRGQSSEYLARARPIADSVVRSRHVHKWVEGKERGYEAIGAMRRALADDLVLMFLGFADGGDTSELEQSLAELQSTRATLKRRIASLKQQSKKSPPPASPAPGNSEDSAFSPNPSRAERSQILRDIQRANGQLEKLERQITARNRALPLFREAAKSDTLIDQLRQSRDHPVHSLLRRLHHESQQVDLTVDGGHL